MINPTIQKIKEHYNGDFDIIPTGPMVTWVEYDLVILIESLFKRIENLENYLEKTLKVLAGE